jgi:hypothetical protein
MFCSNSKCRKILYVGATVCPHCSQPVTPKTTNEMAVGYLRTLLAIAEKGAEYFYLLCPFFFNSFSFLRLDLTNSRYAK